LVGDGLCGGGGRDGRLQLERLQRDQYQSEQQYADRHVRSRDGPAGRNLRADDDADDELGSGELIMKNWTLKASAMALAIAAGSSIGCSSSGCSGTNINQNSNSSGPVSMTCGQGTYMNSANQCVPLPSAAAAPAAAPVSYVSH
jgi:hypothetical protein